MRRYMREVFVSKEMIEQEIVEVECLIYRKRPKRKII